MNIEDTLTLLPDDTLLDILRIIIIRLGQCGLATMDELALLVSIEETQSRAQRVA